MEQKTNVLENRLLKYSFAAGTLLAAASSMNGQIAYTDVNPDYTIPGNGSYTIDFSNNEFQIRSLRSTSTVAMGWLSENTTGGAWIKRAMDRPKALASQYVISASKSFANNHADSGNRLFWAAGSSDIMSWFMDGGSFENATNYLGVKFKIGANTHYGWIKIYTNSNGVMTISEYAYETQPGVGIKAGEKAVSLPVELTSLTANLLNNNVVLNWETATEVNNYGFNVERKTETGNWDEIGFVEGVGNSNTAKSYLYTDNTITTGKYVYRLKQIDLDGKFEYSKAVEVTVYKPAEFSLIQNYPNPFNPATTIKYSIPEAAGNELVILKVYNMLGEEVATLVNSNQASGNYEVKFDASQLASGIYVYKLAVGDKFTANKKMMLIK